MRNKYILAVLNMLALTIFTAITMGFIFMVWELQNLEVFALAFILIIIAVAAVWAVVLFRSKLHGKYGIPVVTSATIITIVYYVVIMVYTGIFAGLFKTLIPPAVFMGIAAVIFLLYLLVMIGMVYTAFYKAGDISRQNLEKSRTMEINILLINIESELKKKKSYISPQNYKKIELAFEAIQERQKMSSPFGRVQKDEVIALEKDIFNRLQVALEIGRAHV